MVQIVFIAGVVGLGQLASSCSSVSLVGMIQTRFAASAVGLFFVMVNAPPRLEHPLVLVFADCPQRQQAALNDVTSRAL